MSSVSAVSSLTFLFVPRLTASPTLCPTTFRRVLTRVFVASVLAARRVFVASLAAGVLRLMGLDGLDELPAPTLMPTGVFSCKNKKV